VKRLLDDMPLKLPSGIKPNLGRMPSSKAAKAGLAAVGGAAALTAASARISSLRKAGSSDDS
jgi:hypothetical protein